ncbi:MAG: sulfur carrier protein ThiS adenylyltransferase ThiF [Candidatus Cloacimonetes bacterium]|nr:sulfur carrier protein ThiS adenylyltransferase ThiF [Candidatus Cloacimonadota bacterium]
MRDIKSVFFSHHDPDLLPAIRKAVIGIAGAGGLGSNVAFTLARVGIGTLIIADHDSVDITNLNRQQYFLDQVGDVKVEALKINLKRINPFSEYIMHNVEINENNIPTLFDRAQILIEAFDRAEMKKMLIETWTAHYPQRPIIVASGLAGFGKSEKIHIRQFENLFVVGDEESELKPKISPMAPRVGIVANMQANLALELIIKKKR